MNSDPRTSSNGRMRFAREGYPFMFGAVLFAAAASVAVPILGPGPWTILPASLLILLATFVFYFFRDPEREIPSEEGVVICPGDGKIIDIREVDEPSFIKGACRRITIFLSVFNVHVQRAPVSGDVAHREYRPGKYAVAWHPLRRPLGRARTVADRQHDGVCQQPGWLRHPPRHRATSAA